MSGEATRKWEFARAENYISPSRHRYVNRTTNFPFANLNSHTFGIYLSLGWSGATVDELVFAINNLVLLHLLLDSTTA